MPLHPLLPLFARLFLGLMWVFAALGKFTRRGSGGNELFKTLGVQPERLTAGITTALPFVELALGLALILGFGGDGAAYGSLGLLLVFTAVILAVLAQGRRIECNCFGSLGRAPLSHWSVARNGGFILLALLALHPAADYLTLDSLLSGTVKVPEAPLSDLVPMLVMLSVALVLAALGTAAWEVGSLVARAKEGPALLAPDRDRLRRWFRVL